MLKMEQEHDDDSSMVSQACQCPRSLKAGPGKINESGQPYNVIVGRRATDRGLDSSNSTLAMLSKSSVEMGGAVDYEMYMVDKPYVRGRADN